MINFSVGFNGQISDLRRILNTSNKIYSVYTGGLSGKIAGGRPQYLKDVDSLSEQIKFAHGKGVLFEIALNAPCAFEDKSDTTWWNEIRRYLLDLERCGVDYIIASHPFLMELVKDSTNMKLTVSTICEITTARSALYYEAIGADVIVPSMNMNYDIAGLESISKTLRRAKLRIMVNEHCLGDCPWRRFHHNHYSHSNTEQDYHYHCKTQFLRHPYLVLTNNTIRPEDIKEYMTITDAFKIVGRLVPIDDLVMRIKAYDCMSFQGNYVSLFDSKMSKLIKIPNEQLANLFGHKAKCNKVCEKCEYCIDLLRRATESSQPVIPTVN